jgi:hypothetical protein
MVQSVAQALSKTPRFAPALKDHPPAAATIAAALAGEFASPMNFLEALKRGVSGLVPTRLRSARGMYIHITVYDPRNGSGAAAAAAVDTAESWLHGTRHVVTRRRRRRRNTSTRRNWRMRCSRRNPPSWI